MIILKAGIPNKDFSNNTVNRNKVSFYFVYLVSIINYFMSSKENLYFLILSLFQVSTSSYINLIPKHYSPTGPWSTFIPLLFCVILEVIHNYCSWFHQYFQDKEENNRKIKCFNSKNLKWEIVKNGSIRPGNIISLEKDDCVPVDGIIISNTSSINCEFNLNKTIKISLSPLTGETTLIAKETIDPSINLKSYVNFNTELSILDYGGLNLSSFTGYLYLYKNKECCRKIKIDGNNFIPSGSIIKSDRVSLLVTSCGNDKKCVIQKKNLLKKTNYIDQEVGKLMIMINLKILLAKILIITIGTLYYSTNIIDIVSFGFLLLTTMIQTWILFNGVIPFSIKIFLITIRTFQKYNLNKIQFDIINQNSETIDVIPNVTKILSDKTGTITKNELELTNIVFSNDKLIYNVDSQFPENITYLVKNNMEKENKLNLLRCIGICIHFEDNQFKTIEDKTIRNKSVYVNCIVQEKNDKIKLQIYNQIEEYKTYDIDGLDFNHQKPISSKIVKRINEYDNEYYLIFCKGSVNEIKKRLRENQHALLEESDLNLLRHNPLLRVMACAYRKITKEEFESNKGKSNYEWETKLYFLGLLGIRDNIQKKVKETILHLNQLPNPIQVCMLTGDRAITSLAISKEINLYKKRSEVHEITYNTIDIVSNFIHWSIMKKITVLFSGLEFNKICNDDISYLKFIKIIINPKVNFIAYSLIPSMKLKLALIFKNNKIPVLSIGDGFNDIGMLRNSNVGVCVKNTQNKHVQIYADYVVNKFSNLQKIIKNSYENYKKNIFISHYFFLKSIFISFMIFIYLIINSFNTAKILFSGFSIQLLNITSCILITYYGYITINNKKKNENKKQLLPKINVKTILKSCSLGVCYSLIASSSYYCLYLIPSLQIYYSNIAFILVQLMLDYHVYCKIKSNQ